MDGVDSIPASAQAVGQPSVSVHKLTKVYNTRRGEVVALNDVSIDIPAGEILVLLGPSGCGKTTLLRSIAGLEQPTSGKITVHGRTVYSSSARLSVPPEKRKLSMVFQSYALWPHMTVFENVAFPLKIARTRAPEIEARVADALAVAGLETFAANYPGQLSGGQQQRVALARALVSNTGLILFDEPLSNLDAKVRERLRDELLAMQQQFGFTAIYVTHDQVEAAALAHRVAVMEVGRVAQLGSAQEIFNAPRSPYVADFVGCTNTLTGKIVGRAEGLVRIETALGTLLGVAEDAGLDAGAAVRVMFRPEHGRIVSADNAGPNLIRARIERSLFLGSHMEFQLSAEGQPLMIRSMDRELAQAGAEITVQVDPRLTRVYAAD
jgi:iron(III) transport system ATP-binding protein